MSDANDETTVDVVGVNDVNGQPVPSTSIPEKRKREVRSRSIAWEHFTKLIQEDGTYDKCQCIHCNRLFSHTGGTTHLLRHIRDGSCPGYNKEKTDMSDMALSSRRVKSEPRKNPAGKFDQVMGHPDQQMDMQDDGLPVVFYDVECKATETFEEEYGGRSSTTVQGRRPKQLAVRYQPRGESWMNELRACVVRLVDLTSETVPRGGDPVKPCSVITPDYSIATALRCLNEMVDIPQSSEMYLDTFELLKNAGERECFVCLPPEPRRRWLQRMLHRCYPSRYDYDV